MSCECKYQYINLLTEKAQNGDVNAQYELGRCYYYGNNIICDRTEAVKWYRRAAEKGHVKAQYDLAECYLQGEGIADNEFEAIKWYHRAAIQGYANAQFSLAYVYEHYGEKEYMEKAKFWYHKAAEGYQREAEKGNIDAQYNLGDCFFRGKGVPEDKHEALKLYSKAAKGYRRLAEKGNSDAQYKLATCYFSGKGVNPSDSVINSCSI